MKHFQRIGAGILTGAAIAIVAPTPAFAQTQVQDIRLVEMNGEVALVLVTRSGERPEVFVVRRGNDFVADIINTQLPAQKQNFQQNNPIPGIASVVVTQLDSTSVRVIVSGVNSPPEARIMQGANEGIVISMGASAGAVAQVPNQVPNPPAPPPPASNPPARGTQPVLVPDPQITIGGRNVPQGGMRPSDAAPPFIPRAVAPPLGDIAVSNVNAGIPVIRLNTTQRIPRLVLRDAPVSDVLALLARTAGLNLAVSNLFKENATGEFRAPNGELEEKQITGRKISLDIENESVEDVFNYVLRLSGLQANRVGNTIFVGVKLPTTASDVVVRSLRLNQVPAKIAAGFLSSQGAGTQIQIDQIRIEQVGIGVNSRYVETRTPTITELAAKESDSPLVLKGLSISVDERLNSITLIGPPYLVETGVAMLTQMDLRQRQVAVNVKVVDVNLSGEEAASSSFSFGVNDTFFVNDGGAASVNFGGYNPPNRTTATTGINGRPIVPNTPLAGQAPFYNRNGLAVNPLTAPGGGVSLDPIAPVTERPGQVGVSEYKPYTRDLATGALTALGTTTNSIFPFFQYPRKFLSTLTAQIVSGNAKILTDPTLVVQEGETAKVALVEEIVKSVTTTFVDTVSGTRDSKDFTFQNVGLTLDVNVERIDDNGFVSMRINPTVSAPGDQVDAGGGDFARQILSRTVESGLIRLRDGQTLILSGIIQEQERATVSKIPLLGDLPIIGSLFRRTNKQNSRAEVIVLVTPQILDDSDRAPYGYEYNPSPDALRMMQRR
ncbi:bifunctional pilus assembly protein PilQ/type II secretion pathway protein D [Planktothrix agardhii CCAP 1459/11A]|uniref:Bifunctional pilus assembly protein PilQ/type II secretion pathway protein D n=1 Tax=Planktothrix agardhii CCAP 1459/11A TaxID=282420 RepID=A0A479ZPW3_PLAAG|nr:AMIN domain-containing protein [Planktothrix agardhii]GCL34515.1 bifunctional pilus assembly protein PilQ/type II secretion pathway protein D [Planktothrix agardhii CCAP 1459/11A]